jgi:capsular exopolysaccharide synthesis family protein
VTSSSAGEGKTTTTVNLATALGMVGHRVVLVEADLRQPVVADLFGLEEGSVGLSDVLAGRAHTAQAIQRTDKAFDLLSAGPPPPNPSELVASRRMTTVLEELRAAYDYVLIDCPSLLPMPDTASIAPATDGVIVVCRFKTTQAQLAAAVDTVTAVSAPVLGSVLTMVPRRSAARFVPDLRPRTSVPSARTVQEPAAPEADPTRSERLRPASMPDPVHQSRGAS